MLIVVFFKQKTAYEMRISDWSSDVCSSDLIRTYLMLELGVTEVTPATLVPRLSKDFLEAQPDDWVLRLYEFLSGQEAALRRSLDKVPLIRLDDGAHEIGRAHV